MNDHDLTAANDQIHRKQAAVSHQLRVDPISRIGNPISARLSKSETKQQFCWDCGKILKPGLRGSNPFQCPQCAIDIPIRREQERIASIRRYRRGKAAAWRAALDQVIPLAYQESRLSRLSHSLRDKLRRVDQWLYLWGPAGAGKTYAMYALLRSRIIAGESCIFTRWTSLASALREAVRNGDGDAAIVQRFIKEDVVVIDDILGGDTETDFVRTRLLEIVDGRIDRGCGVWFTSNRPVEDIKTVFDERLYSRIAGHCQVLKLSGKDRRISK